MCEKDCRLQCACLSRRAVDCPDRTARSNSTDERNSSIDQTPWNNGVDWNAEQPDGLSCICLRRCWTRCATCRSLCFKIFLVVVNFTFMGCGILMFCVGIWMHFKHMTDSTLIYSILFSDNPTNPTVVFDRFPFLFMTVGIVVSITSFLGCCGACAENICFLSFYSLFLISMMTAEVILATVLFTYKIQFSQELMSSMRFQVRYDYNKTGNLPNKTSLQINRLTQAWDQIQNQLHCCGASGPQDYRHSSWQNHTKDQELLLVPLTCCRLDPIGQNISKIKYRHCQAEAIHNNIQNDFMSPLHSRGCHTSLVRLIDSYLEQVFMFVVCLVTIQLLDTVLACVLMSWVRKKQVDYWWWDEEDGE